MAPGSKRTKMVRASARLRAIQAVRATGGKSKAQRNAIAIAMARKNNKKFAVLERQHGGKALFQVMKRAAPRMVWDLSRGSVRVSAHPTLGPALQKVSAQFESIAMRAVEKQFRFHKLFGY